MSASGPVDAFLPRVKRQPVLAHPSGPEDLRALLRRVDTPGYAAQVLHECRRRLRQIYRRLARERTR